METRRASRVGMIRRRGAVSIRSLDFTCSTVSVSLCIE